MALICGPCSFVDLEQKDSIIKCAEELKGIADIFRCKIWLGGTSPEKYCYPAFVNERLEVLSHINKSIMPVITEIHLTEHIINCHARKIGIWIGARNSANYSLLREASRCKNDVYVKRGTAMTVNETIGIYDIMEKINGKQVKIIERGTVNFDRTDDSRWKLSINDSLKLKYDRPDIFKNLIIDCSHSMGRSEFVGDCYKAFKAIGCENFMFECTIDGQSKTDARQMISVKDVKNIVRDYIWT